MCSSILNPKTMGVTMRVKTSELSGSALDWAVAHCDYTDPDTCSFVVNHDGFRPSADWAQGGPIIERYCINLFRLDPKTEEDNRFWVAHIDGVYCRYGVSALVAAMRCYVASKLGEEVDVPNELTLKEII
jgi:hypothetical protein